MLRFSTIAILLAIFAYACADVKVIIEADDESDMEIQPYAMEETIKEMVKNISDKLAKIDPLPIPTLKFNFGNDIINADFEATDILLRGFSKFAMENLKISVIKRQGEFLLTFDQIQAVAPYYNLNALAVFIPLYGSGTFNLMVKKIDIEGVIKVTITIKVKEMKIKFNLAESNLRVTGLLHNEPMSDIVSTATTECFPEFINTYGQRFGDLLSGPLTDIINGFLSKPKSDADITPVPTNYSGTVQHGPNTFKYYFEV